MGLAIVVAIVQPQSLTLRRPQQVVIATVKHRKARSMSSKHVRHLSLLILALILNLNAAAQAPRVQAQAKSVDPGLSKAGSDQPVPVACTLLYRKSTPVPVAAINAALENPEGVNGWNQLQYPSKPESPFNLRRRALSLLNTGKPYDPLTNGLQFKGGCY